VVCGGDGGDGGRGRAYRGYKLNRETISEHGVEWNVVLAHSV